MNTRHNNRFILIVLATTLLISLLKYDVVRAEGEVPEEPPAVTQPEPEIQEETQEPSPELSEIDPAEEEDGVLITPSATELADLVVWIHKVTRCRLLQMRHWKLCRIQIHFSTRVGSSMNLPLPIAILLRMLFSHVTTPFRQPWITWLAKAGCQTTTKFSLKQAILIQLQQQFQASPWMETAG